MIALRLVIDTNIVVSAALKPDGLQRTVLLLPLTSRPGSMSPRPFSRNMRPCSPVPSSRSARASGSKVLQSTKTRAHRVTSAKQLQVTADPDDSILLECADAARADYLVTGNQRHFPKFWKKTKVITSREFVSIVAPHLIS